MFFRNLEKLVRRNAFPAVVLSPSLFGGEKRPPEMRLRSQASQPHPKEFFSDFEVFEKAQMRGRIRKGCVDRF